MKCLHCGKHRANYCEQCYQDLIVDNLKLQFKIKKLESQLKREHKPKHLKEDCNDSGFTNDMWKHIPKIEAYFSEGGIKDER